MMWTFTVPTKTVVVLQFIKKYSGRRSDIDF